MRCWLFGTTSINHEHRICRFRIYPQINGISDVIVFNISNSIFFSTAIKASYSGTNTVVGFYFHSIVTAVSYNHVPYIGDLDYFSLPYWPILGVIMQDCNNDENYEKYNNDESNDTCFCLRWSFNHPLELMGYLWLFPFKDLSAKRALKLSVCVIWKFYFLVAMRAYDFDHDVEKSDACLNIFTIVNQAYMLENQNHILLLATKNSKSQAILKNIDLWS